MPGKGAPEPANSTDPHTHSDLPRLEVAALMGDDASSSSLYNSCGGMELVANCDLCGSTNTATVFANCDRFFRVPGEFSLLRCTSCGMYRLSPRPNSAALPAYYPPDNYYAYTQPAMEFTKRGRLLSRARSAVRSAGLSRLGYDTAPSPAWARLAVQVSRRWLVRQAAYGKRGFPPWNGPGRALDVGCGSGGFLVELRRHGWDVTGVEVDPTAAATARAISGAEVYEGELDDSPFVDGTFDFVHMSHVIEHVRLPMATLRRAASLLRPAGRLYIETPNIDSFSFRRCREFWFPLETPRHFWLFSYGTLKHALAASGFRILSIGTARFPSFSWEATYRREERERCLLSSRPALQVRDLPRAMVFGGINWVLPSVSPASGDILCCWAERSDAGDAGHAR